MKVADTSMAGVTSKDSSELIFLQISPLLPYFSNIIDLANTSLVQINPLFVRFGYLTPVFQVVLNS